LNCSLHETVIIAAARMIINFFIFIVLTVTNIINLLKTQKPRHTVSAERGGVLLSKMNSLEF